MSIRLKFYDIQKLGRLIMVGLVFLFCLPWFSSTVVAQLLNKDLNIESNWTSGLNVESLAMDSPHRSGKYNPYFNNRLQSSWESNLSLSVNGIINKKIGLRLGFGYTFGKGYYGMPIVDFDGGVVDVHKFDLNRHIFKLHISKIFKFNESPFSIETRLGVFKVFEDFTILRLNTNNVETFLPNREYDLFYELIRNNYGYNPNFSEKDLRKLKLEPEIIFRYQIWPNINATLNIRYSAFRYIAYDRRYQVRTYNPDTGELTVLWTNLGKEFDTYDYFGSHFKYLHFGLGVSYTLNKRKSSNPHD